MIELGKKYRTRDGREVRIYAVEGGESPSVHAAFLNDDGWEAANWYRDGHWYKDEDHPLDLIEVQPELWHPIFINLCGEAVMSSTTYPTKEAAMAHEPVHPIDAWLDPRSGK